MARALVVSIAKIEKDCQYYDIINNRRPLQSHLAKELHQKAKVPLGACGLNEVKQFQTYLSDYQINIVSKEHQNSILYSGPENEKRVYLYFHDNHYDVITSMAAFFARERYCHICKKAYDHQGDHICPNASKLCYYPECATISWMHCDACNRYFKSKECFDRHKQTSGNAKSICSSLVKCTDCNTVVKRNKRRPEKYHCGMKKCSLCNEYVHLENHRFYMRPVKKGSMVENEHVNLLDNEAEDEDVTEAEYNQLLFFFILNVAKKMVITNPTYV